MRDALGALWVSSVFLLEAGPVSVRQAGETVSLPLEDYVAAVLAGEAGPYTGDALRAVAVAARTYA
ncbi:MAG: SpoIID/LytB domain-containing protein, partial [Bryobacteraceae bacterium]